MTTTRKQLRSVLVGVFLVLALASLPVLGQEPPLTVSLSMDPAGHEWYLPCTGSVDLVATAAGGTEPYAYTWYHNGDEMSGKTDDHITLTAPGSYAVIVSDDADPPAEATASVVVQASAISISGDVQGVASPYRITANISGACPPWTYTLTGPGVSKSWTEEDVWSVAGYPDGGHSVIQPGVYTLTVEDDLGCEAETQVRIIEVSLSMDPAGNEWYLRCDEPVDLIATVSGGSGSYQYVWRRTGTVLTDETGDRIELPRRTDPDAPAKVGTYSVAVTDQGAPSASALASALIQRTELSIDATYEPGDGSYTIYAEIRDACPTWDWAITGPSEPKLEGEGIVWSATDYSFGEVTEAGTYTLSVTDALGCPATSTLEIAPLRVSLGDDLYLPCDPPGVTLVPEVTGGSGEYTYDWCRDDEPLGLPDDTSSYEVTMAGTYEVTVHEGPQQATDSVVVEETELSITAYAVRDPTVCGRSEVYMSVAAVYGSAAFSLEDPNGGQVLTKTMGTSGMVWNSENELVTDLTLVAPDDTPGDYVLRVTDALGCTAECSFAVPVAERPAVSFPVTITSPYWLTCSSPSVLLVTLVEGGMPPYGYSWSPGGQVSSEIEVSYTPPGPTWTDRTYEVTVTDSWQCAGCASVEVKPDMTPPTVSITANPPQLELTCSVETITLTGNPSGSTSYAYLWRKDALAVGTDQSLAVSSPGVYVLTVTGANGCSSDASVEIVRTVQLPTVAPGPDRLLTCANPSATLVASVCCGTEPYRSYIWSEKVGEDSYEYCHTGSSYTVSTQGVYRLCVTDAAWCTGCGDYTVVESKEYPIVEGGGERFLTCTEPSVTLDTTVSGGVTPYTYNWTHDGVALETHTEDISVSEPGTYVLTVIGDNGCATPSAPFVVIEDKEPPAVEWVADWELTCTKPSVELVATSIDGAAPAAPPCAYTYYWSPGGETSERITVWAPGTYTLLVTGENGCTSSCDFVVRFADRWAPEYHDVLLEIGEPPTGEGAMRLHFTGTVWDDCCVQVNGVQVAVGELTGNGTVTLETAERTQALGNEVFVEGDLLVEHMTGCPVIPYLEVAAADCRGNESSETWTLELNDTTAPGLRGFETVFLTSGDTGSSAVEFAFVVQDNWCILASALQLALTSDGTARTGLLHVDVAQAAHTRLEITGSLTVADPVPCTFPLWFEIQAADCCGVTLKTTEEVWYPDTAAPRVTGAETLGDGWVEGGTIVELPVHLLIEDDRCLDVASIAWELRCPEGCAAVPTLALHELSPRRAEIRGTIRLENPDRCPVRWELAIEAGDCCGNAVAASIPSPPTEGEDGAVLVRNGSFENGLMHWSYDGAGEAPFDVAEEEGNVLLPASAVAAAMPGSAGPFGCLYQEVGCWLVPGERYVLSASMRRADTNGPATVSLRYVDAQGSCPPGGEVAAVGFFDTGGTTDEWTAFTSDPFVLPSMPAGCVALRLELRSEATAGATWWDEVGLAHAE